MWPEGEVNSIHKAIRGVGAAAGTSVNHHLVSDWVLSAAQLNRTRSTPLKRSPSLSWTTEKNHINDVQFSHGNWELMWFSISITSIMQLALLFILSELTHSCLKYTHTISYIPLLLLVIIISSGRTATGHLLNLYIKTHLNKYLIMHKGVQQQWLIHWCHNNMSFLMSFLAFRNTMKVLFSKVQRFSDCIGSKDLLRSHTATLVL